MKEFCKCGHSRKSHVNDFGNTRCCCVWQTKEDLDNRGSLLRFCECMAYSSENEQARTEHGDSFSKKKITNALKSNSNKRDGNSQNFQIMEAKRE